MAEERLFGSEFSLVPELPKDQFHLGEYLGAGELGDDEVIGEEGVAEGLLWRGMLVRVQEQAER